MLMALNIFSIFNLIFIISRYCFIIEKRNLYDIYVVKNKTWQEGFVQV